MHWSDATMLDWAWQHGMAWPLRIGHGDLVAEGVDEIYSMLRLSIIELINDKEILKLITFPQLVHYSS